MTIEERLRLEFDDDTAYERLVLETIVDPVMAPQGAAEDDIRGDGRKSYSRSAFDSVGARSAEAVAERFRPLAFGAAYKILDFVVEMTMRLNNEPCPRLRWTFQEKAAYLARAQPAGLPTPIDAAPSLWERVTGLYTVLDEHRHALVHRRARVEVNGDFTGSDRAGASLHPITTAEMDALSRATLALARSIISATGSPRDVNLIAWELNSLDGHHQCGQLAATKPPNTIVRVIDDMHPVGPRHWRVNGVKLHAHLRQQNRPAIDADIELHGGNDVIYTARCDEVPDSVIEVDPVDLPAWLHPA